MPRKNLHDQPFDEGTIAKLEIFEDYAQAWIPTFVMQNFSKICIFDFFAGTGYDRNGIAGSPIRILQKIEEQIPNMSQQSTIVHVFLNEFDRKKFDLLKIACESYIEERPSLKSVVKIQFYNEDFEKLFPKLFPEIEQFPALVYLDQNGIKFLSEKYFLELEKTRQTDFLYFVSTSYFWRFGSIEEFKIHLDIDINEAKKNPYRFIHRSIIKQLREKLPVNTKLKLHPFSLKKGANIYGIIFGASHPRAVDKFLNIAWKRNGINGEANFDIDDDKSKVQGLLFEAPQLTKIEVFKQSVSEKILSQEIQNNFQLFDYVLQEAHLGKHAAEVLKELKKKGEIFYEGNSPLVTYDKVYKPSKRQKLEYKVIKK